MKKVSIILTDDTATERKVHERFREDPKAQEILKNLP
jgi:hypothetical protein